MYSPRHALPSCLPVRSVVGTSLTAVLLPLALAAPALAQESPQPTTSATPTATATPGATAAPEASSSPTADPREQTTMRISATEVGGDGRSSVGVRLLADGRGVPGSTVDVQAQEGGAWSSVAQLTTNDQGLAVGSLPFSQSTRIRAVHLGSATRTPGTSPEIVVVKKQVVTMRISATQAGADGRSRIGVRLLADGRAVQNGYLRLEAKTGSGWQYIGRLLSNAEGLGTGSLPFQRDTRIRATYAGSSTRTAGVTPEVVVKANSFGQRAVQIASEQAGKPYRYGATGPSSFDCSGFTTYIYKTRLGKDIPRTSAQQEASIPRVAQSAKRPGDLLFFRTNGRVTHVGVYAGGGRMWASPTTGDRVKLQAIYTSRYTVGRVG